MKTFSFLFLVVAPSLPAAVVAGNDGAIVSVSSHAANFLLGQQVQLTNSETITHFGANFQTTPGEAQFAVYDSTGSSGGPGQLMAQTSKATIAALGLDAEGYGEVSLESATTLPAGDYWLMGVFSLPLNIGETTTASGTTTAFRSHVFGTDLPDSGASFSAYTDHEFGYYIAANVPEPSTLPLVLTALVLLPRRRTA